MAEDLERQQALRAAGFAAEVDTADPPGKVTVVFDLADFDALIATLVDGDPRSVLTARAEGHAEGRSDAEAVAALNVRRQVAAELVAARDAGALAEKVDQLARDHGPRPVPPRPEVDPVRDAMAGTGPTDGPLKKGQLRG